MLNRVKARTDWRWCRAGDWSIHDVRASDISQLNIMSGDISWELLAALVDGDAKVDNNTATEDTSDNGKTIQGSIAIGGRQVNAQGVTLWEGSANKTAPVGAVGAAKGLELWVGAKPEVNGLEPREERQNPSKESPESKEEGDKGHKVVYHHGTDGEPLKAAKSTKNEAKNGTGNELGEKEVGGSGLLGVVGGGLDASNGDGKEKKNRGNDNIEEQSSKTLNSVHFRSQSIRVRVYIALMKSRSRGVYPKTSSDEYLLLPRVKHQVATRR